MDLITRLKLVIGNLVVENNDLTLQLENITKHAQALTIENDELQKRPLPKANAEAKDA